MTIAVTLIESAQLREIRARVFRTRETTVADAARAYGLADYEATLTGMRREMRELVETLPDTAFELQLTSDDPRWSAGEVVGHIRHAQMNIYLPAARAAVARPPGRGAQRPDADGVHPALSRIAALAVLDDAGRDLADFFRELPWNVDLDDTIEDERLGTVGLRDALLYLAIHDDDHLGQLRELTAHDGLTA
jgi:hypothetical protein